MSVLIFVTPKPNDNFSLTFLLTFMQKNFFDFLSKILSCRSSGHNQPTHPHHSSSIFDSITDRVKQLVSGVEFIHKEFSMLFHSEKFLLFLLGFLKSSISFTYKSKLLESCWLTIDWVFSQKNMKILKTIVC